MAISWEGLFCSCWCGCRVRMPHNTECALAAVPNLKLSVQTLFTLDVTLSCLCTIMYFTLLNVLNLSEIFCSLIRFFSR